MHARTWVGIQRALSFPSRASGYHKRVLDHFEQPRNVGSFCKEDPCVGTGLVGAPACGDVMQLQVRTDADGVRIVDARFKTFGCGSAIASSSIATEWIKGMKIEDAQNITNRRIARYLHLPPIKLHCSVLAEDAIRSAVKDLERKRSRRANDDAQGMTDVQRGTNET